MNEVMLEKEKLKQVIHDYEDYINDTKLELKNIRKLYPDPDVAEEKEKKLKKKLERLEENINKPYFARIDFKSDTGVEDICYIGKIGVTNYDNEIIVVDWRAPISSLYYDSSLGKASYVVDGDTIEGILEKKRQYEIENRELIQFTDVDTVSNDELLKPYLGVKASERTKNIVSTIQQEQNEIIRSSLFQNRIIQGVAGSGKTTVALHRIAYLAYRYRDLIRNDQYMVIGPNKFFIQYISTMLPELDVDDVIEYDLLELTEDFSNQKIQLEDENELIQKYLEGYHSPLSKMKTSFEYQQLLDLYFQNYFQTKLNTKPIMLADYPLITSQQIQTTWKEVLKRGYEDLKKAVDRLVLLLNRYCDTNQEKITLEINQHIDHLVEQDINHDVSIQKYRDLRTQMIHKFRSQRKQVIQNHFQKMFPNILTVYQDFKQYLNEHTENPILKTELDEKIYVDDLPALLYITYKLHGTKYEKYRHIVIDEAQDYNTFTFYVLRKLFPKASFDIYGDLAQSIYDYRSLDSWESIQESIFSDAEIVYLNKSYRTTIEIMEEANKINQLLHLPEANAVIRHGKEVVYEKIQDLSDILSYLHQKVEEGLQSIAIICKSECEKQKLSSFLERHQDRFSCKINDPSDLEGIHVFTAHAAKGLEFDSVFIYQLDDFHMEHPLEMKLLYVAMTRALHTLTIFYQKRKEGFLD